MTTNWTNLLSSKKNVSKVVNFARGQMSGQDFYSHFTNTENGGTVRGLLRDHGVNESRRLARKALSRRGINN